MSGTIFMSSESSEEIENKWNPLHCHLCHEQYEEPCILQCYHSFCAACLENKAQDGKLACPLCGTVTLIKEDNQRPPSDALLKFLVESASGDKTPCANCDQVQPQMYFCTTCSQSLCVQCREETHAAKMFQSHEIMLQTKHTRDIQKHCGVHNEPYILFSTEKKVMLCINCFRDMKVESRSHCVDLETAYKQGCQKLDDTMQSIRDLQNSVRDGILLLRALLEEVESNVGKEKAEIQQLYDTMQELISDMHKSLLAEIDRQYEEKVELFKHQLVSLTTFLPTLRVHLVTCAAFASSANKYEFLDFTYVLMKRLMSIIQVQHPLHPSQTSDIVTDYKAKFAKCLEPLLFPHRNGAPVTVSNPIVPNVACTRYDVSPCISSPPLDSCGNQQLGKGSQDQNKNTRNKKKFKLKLMDTKGFFADHCKEFDTSHRDFMGKVTSIKQSVQELQRDITLRRSLTREVTIKELKVVISQTEDGLDVHQVSLEGKQGGLEQHWEESLERIAAEQEVYQVTIQTVQTPIRELLQKPSDQAQLQDVTRLKTEVASVKVILEKLSSFVTSIASVTQRLAPKLSKATLAMEQDDSHAIILHEINTMQPDSQQRVDAISRTEEVRDHKLANRVNPLDEELIKTKGLLRAPSRRKENPMKRLSAEIKDLMIEESAREKHQPEKERAGSKSPEVKLDKDKTDSKSLEVKLGKERTECKSPDIKLDKDKTENKVSEVNHEFRDAIETLDSDKKVSDRNDLESAVKVNMPPDELIVAKEVAKENQDKLESEPARDVEGERAAEVADSSNQSVDNSDTSISNDVEVSDLGANCDSQTMPDVMIQVLDGSVKDNGKDKDKDIVENGEVKMEFTVEMTNSALSGAESDFNTSTESYQSSEESVKPGLVKDLVAMVDKRIKPVTVGISEIGGIKSPASKSPKFKALDDDQTDPIGEMNGACVNNSAICEASADSKDIEVDIEKELLENSPEKANKSLLKKSPESANKLPKVGHNASLTGDDKLTKIFENVSDISQTVDKQLSKIFENVSDGSPTIDGASADDEEAYKAKSLPELAQVFEPGELKQKRRRSRSARAKHNNEHGSEGDVSKEGANSCSVETAPERHTSASSSMGGTQQKRQWLLNCETCSYSTLFPLNLRRHKNAVHLNKTYSCDMCNAKYSGYYTCVKVDLPCLVIACPHPTNAPIGELYAIY